MNLNKLINIKRILVLVFGLTLCACNKDKEAFITLISPEINSSFSAGQSIPIKINLSAKDGLDVFHLKVVNVLTNNAVFDWQHVITGKSFFQIDTVIKIQQIATYKTSIEAISKKPTILKVETTFSVR